VAASLSWMGISDIKKLGFGLMEHVIWEKLSEKRKKIITTKTIKLAKRYGNKYKTHINIKHYILFAVCKMLHQKTLRKENPISVDNKYWLERKWIKNKG
jgi:hypothetical protein